MHRCTNPLLKVFLNSTNQQSMMKTVHHKRACGHCIPQANASDIQASLLHVEATGQQVPGHHWPKALPQGSLKPSLSNSNQKPLFPALCFVEYHDYEHCFIVRKLLDLSQHWEHLRGPFRGMLSGRVDGLNHMAPVKSHAEPWEITSDKEASSLPFTEFYVWNKTLSTDTWGNIRFLNIQKL